MEDIRPSITNQDILCAEEAAPPSGIVVFGASGDLARRKLLGSLAKLMSRDLLSERFYLLGCGRKPISDENFRALGRDAIADSDKQLTPEIIERFTEKLYYIGGNYDDPGMYQSLRERIGELSKKHDIDGCTVFYLAVPPFLYPTIIEQLGRAGLACPHGPGSESCVRLVVEKPFGRDLETAVQLNDQIATFFDESQVYRIDHYLGKETVQNLLMFRFANSIFEPVWNRSHIDHIQITIAEKLGIEHRGGYYDKSGALRDMFQNHMLQMLSLVAMEPPTSFEANRVRDEKVKLLRSIRPLTGADVDKFVVRGQYSPGVIDGEKIPGYREEADVDPDSRTETFVAARLLIDNWRWRDVPFYLRTGKRLARKNTEIAITFRKVPHSLFAASGLEDMPHNVLVFRIQPEEGMSLSFQAKRPGSKICMATLNMSFDYESIFRIGMPEAYQRLLLDCLTGDQTLFTRFDAVRHSWQLMAPILEAACNGNSLPHEYPAGSVSFPQADNLIQTDQLEWRKL